jgi:hypothetical protein
MLFDLTFPCYLTTFSAKKCLSGKVICACFCPTFRSSLVPRVPSLAGRLYFKQSQAVSLLWLTKMSKIAVVNYIPDDVSFCTLLPRSCAHPGKNPGKEINWGGVSGKVTHVRYRRTSISGTTFSGKVCLSGTMFHAI